MTSTQSADPPFLHAPRQRLESARYKVQQHGLAVGFGVFMRAFHYMMKPEHRAPTMPELMILNRRFDDILERDLQNVRDGLYPREMLFDLPVTSFMKVLPYALVELPRILNRARRKAFDDLPADVQRQNYPEYYLRTFHWQTDGWMSERSARLYDVSVELLFGGAADVMRRMTLPPLVRAIKGMTRPQVLDVACGTARFLAQVHQAIPHAKLYGVDLSHHYLSQARKVLAHVPDVSLLSEAAEHLPFEGNHFDAVTSVFLFHEMPRDARRATLREMFRVLKPGGVVVLNDSVQLSDAPELEFFLGKFHEIYHEPYYKSYLQDDLATALRETGFSVETEDSLFVTKVVSARKPHA